MSGGLKCLYFPLSLSSRNGMIHSVFTSCTIIFRRTMYRSLMKHAAYILGTVVALSLSAPDVGAASDPAKAESLVQSEAAVPANPLKEVCFGEQHVHTACSLDAYIGGSRLNLTDLV